MLLRRYWVGNRMQGVRHALERLAAVAACVCSLLVALTGAASAEPLCTDTWTGGSEGAWQVATNWSSGVLPSATDVACLGVGTTVTVSEGANYAGTVVDAGTLVLQSGSLEVSNPLEPSSVKFLTLKGGTLTGAATVNVSGSLLSEGGRMTGSGATVILPTGSGTLGVKTSVLELVSRTLTNEGTTLFDSGRIYMYSGALIKNAGTFEANSETTEAAFKLGEGTPKIINTGLFEKSEGAGKTGIEVTFENFGTLKGASGTLAFEPGNDVLVSGSVLEGKIQLDFGATVSAGNINATKATITDRSAQALTVVSGDTAKLGTLIIKDGGTLAGPGTAEVLTRLETFSANLTGASKTVVASGASGELGAGDQILQLRASSFLLNHGTLESDEGAIFLDEDSELRNEGTFVANAEDTHFAQISVGIGKGFFHNRGLLLKNKGGGLTELNSTGFDNEGRVIEETGRYNIPGPFPYEESELFFGAEANPSAPEREVAECAEGINCASGNFSEAQTDFAIGGRGAGLKLTRTYNSRAAAAGKRSSFGYGWSSSFSDHLALEPASRRATVTQADGSTVPFAEGEGGSFAAPAWSQDTLTGSVGAGYTLTLADQTAYHFAGSSGRLESVADRNGNTTTLAYNASEQLETITDPGGRTIKLAYNAEGLIETATDPMKHVVKYTYEAGNLATVTQPAEAGLRWQLKYDASHQLTELTDGRGGKTTMEYGSGHQLLSKTDPMKRTTTFEYRAFHTRTTNVATGAVTVTYFTANGQPSAVTQAYGTPIATTSSSTYDTAGDLLSTTDGNGHITTYTYDTNGNRLSQRDATEHETKWTYSTTHDIETETKPNGETTTYKRDTHGNPEAIERPAPGGLTQSTNYTYSSHGQPLTMSDPLKRVSKYEYDAAGDKTAETDPEGDKRTWGYNEDSQEITTVSPRGHIKAGEEAKYTTKTERDALGRTIKLTDPLGHVTKYTLDGDGNIETVTDPAGHVTKYTYDADNERTKTEEPNKTVTEAGYDGAGAVTSQTDGNKHTTKYERNALEQVTAVVDPLSRKTLKEYDAAGNLTSITDPATRTTHEKYDPANRLIEMTYSDGKTPGVKYEYSSDGLRSKMTDGTGTTTYGRDQLDRLTETKDGHGNTTAIEWDLANQQVKLTYPNGKAVTRTYDKARRLEKVTDWLEHTTKFGYDADGNPAATTYPTGTSNEDTITRNQADAITEVKMTRGTETLASLTYTRNANSQVSGTTSKGLPGEEKPAASYDTNNRLTKGGTTAYKYDEANNPTTIGTGSTYKYDAASQLETGPSLKYRYDELGQRTERAPTTGPATTYSYNQALVLTAVARPKQGSTPAIEDSYGYNGDGLRTSQTMSGATTYLAWNLAEQLPLILTDGTDSYIYGPGGLPVEQINNATGVTLYLHHDQQGSTRLVTNGSGTTEASFTYDAYGIQTGHTGTVTAPLGYDGQYTDSDTGLIYLRARYYDPATAQFLSVDPKAGNNTIYAYAESDPLANGDPTGESCRANVRTVTHGTSHACGVLGQLFVTFQTGICSRAGCKGDATINGIAQKRVTQQIRISVKNPAFGSAPIVVHAPNTAQRTPTFHEPLFVPTGSVISIELALTRGRTREVISVELHVDEVELVV